MKKRENIGKVDYDGNGRKNYDVILEWELDNGKFSMSASVWKHSHSDIVMGGQCVDDVINMVTEQYGEAYANEKRLPEKLEIWKRWHLNDMHAGCEHQRQNWDTTKQITIVKYMLNTDIWTKQNIIKAAAIERLQLTGASTLEGEEQKLLSLPLSIDQADYLPLDESISEYYTEKERKTESAGWVRPEKHPDGILCKPCEICGYKYGTSWLKEEIPADVVATIKSW